MKSKAKLMQISGSVGPLELRVVNALVGQASQQGLQNHTLVVISHPHSLYGGTMDNKVVTTMERFFQSIGYSTIAYNFRGVGASAGEYDGGVGEQRDLQSVVDWARSELAFDTLIIAGFSFGAYVTLSAQPKVLADRLLIVAPPVGLYDFSAVSEVQVPWDMLVGLEDEVVDVKEMLNWAMNLSHKPSLYCRAQASHFFHGQLIWLKKVLSLTY